MPSKQLHPWCRRLMLVILFFSPLYLTHAALSDAHSQNIECISGGVGETERNSLLGNQERYSFWLTVAAKSTGAYLSDVHVRISDAVSRTPVLECRMDGPWLFANLPTGRYEVQARYREVEGRPEQILKKTTTIRQGEHRQLVLYFDIPDVTRSEDEASPGAKPNKPKK